MYFIIWYSGQTCLFWAGFREQKCRLSKNQSQRLDLPQGYLATQQVESQDDKAEGMILNLQ